MKTLYTLTITNENGAAVDSIVVAYAPDLVENDYADKDMWDVTVQPNGSLDLEDMVARTILRVMQERDDDETIPSTEQRHLTIPEQAARYWEKRKMQEERSADQPGKDPWGDEPEVSCQYCGSVDCHNDCDESQAGGFVRPGAIWEELS